jgi:hypothetical protein
VIVRQRWHVSVRRLGHVRMPNLFLSLLQQVFRVHWLRVGVGDAGFFVAPAGRPERLTFGSFNLGRIGTPTALEVQVLPNGVVE